MIKFMIVFAALGTVSCSAAKPPLNKKEIEAQIANCGLEFSNPVWEDRGERRDALRVTVAELDLVPETTIKCVTDVSIANGIETQMNADGGQGE